jgi:high-affinity iron transporter
MFSGLRAMAPARCYLCCVALLCLIGAGMVMQATLLLEQVDWLPSAQPLWDSSALVSEQSVTGELLYAVFGYEATPSAVQIGLYVGSLLLMAGSWYVAGRSRTGE